jgi:hypothetical protein
VWGPGLSPFVSSWNVSSARFPLGLKPNLAVTLRPTGTGRLVPSTLTAVTVIDRPLTSVPVTLHGKILKVTALELDAGGLAWQIR